MQGSPKGLENPLLHRFATSFGSPNVVPTGSVCFAPRWAASLVTTGFYPHPDLKQPPELLLVWGSNHLSTSADGILAPEVSSTIREGSKVILIDPFGRNLAKRSELWFQIKPGTDLLLAIGMIKVIKVEFLVVADLFMTPTAQMADIVLPVATHFKFDDLGFYGLPFGKILARPKIVDPPGECKSDVKIINELAKRLKLEDVF